MPELGGLIFAAPWMLWALAVVPLIWWLLRVTPPSPKRIAFPAIRLLFGLERDEETPAKTPPWLIALRLTLATLLIVALAHPVFDPGLRLDGAGPLVVVVDDGWAAARRWERRQEALAEILTGAERAGRTVAIVPTAPAEAAAGAGGLMHATEARALTQALQPRPWPVDRAAAGDAVARLGVGVGADVVWLSDGIDDGNAAAFTEALRRIGRLRVVSDPETDRARALVPPRPGPGALRIGVVRAAPGGDETLWVRATGERGALLAREPARIAAGERSGEAEIDVPIEARNRIVRLDIEGERAAGGVVLLDERWRQRPIGLVSGASIEGDQPLLSEVYYLERALDPFGDVRKGGVRELLQRPLAVLILADVAKLIGEDRALLEDWLDNGGVLLRFAGPRLAEGADDLVPVRLRGGGRMLGGALSWSRPATLAPFDGDSPFAGLAVPREVRVRRQVLAEPSLDLAARTWARLADGTPLVTAERRGGGWLVLIHTTANTAWSNLALSGLFVDMLQRLSGLSQGVTGEPDEGTLEPLQTLDGFGRLVEPPPTSRSLAAAEFAKAAVGPLHPPGFYGAGGARRALNLTAGLGELRAIAPPPAGVESFVYGATGEIDFKPWLLAAAVALALIDLVAGLALRGLLRVGVGGAAAALALLALGAAPARAQGADDFTLKATLETHLAYVRTGNATVDQTSRAGLEGLGAALSARTSIEPAAPMAIDLDTHELIFFPLIYWPITADLRPLGVEALAKVDHYLKTGGMILFDTRDRNTQLGPRLGGPSPRARRLRELLKRLNVPPLQPVPPDHVLTRAFYLMQEFPGRWTGGRVWVERHEGGVNDGVSPLIIGAHDWAAAWAIDAARRPMFPVVPGGERQREQAFRFGVNLVMYAMTGNYKADQVHLPAILERLGQ